MTLVAGVMATTTNASTAPGAGCATQPMAPARCPSTVQRSPDLPSYVSATASDARHHRLYIVGPDESGLMSFHAMDTRTGAFVLHTTMRLTNLSAEASTGINPEQVVLTPDGATLLVAGYVYKPDMLVPGIAAFDTATGRARWAHISYDVQNDASEAVTITPDGRRVFFASGHVGTGSSEECVVEAYDVHTGRRLWSNGYGRNSEYDHWPMSAVFAGGRVLILLDETVNHGGRVDYDSALVGYDPANGHFLGAATYDAGFGDDFLYTATPTSAGVVLTGDSIPSQPTGAIATAVYASTPVAVSVNPRNMRIQWSARPPITGIAGYSYGAVAVGNQVAVLANAGAPRPYQAGAVGIGSSGDVAPNITMFNARDGKQAWTRTLPTPARAVTSITGIATDPAGKTIFAVGWSAPTGTTVSTLAAGPIGTLYRPDMSDGVAYSLNPDGQVVWTADYNVDQTAATYDTDFAAAVVVDHHLFAVGTFDTRTTNPTRGTVNGLVATFSP
jgi:hypothetical protein